MKGIGFILIAFLFLAVGCNNNPVGNRVPDFGKILVAKIATSASDTTLIGEAVLLSGEASKVPEGDSIAKYDWDFGDKNFATGSMTQHKYQAEGNFVVQLKVTTRSGLLDSTKVTIVVVDHFEEKTPTFYLVSSEKQLDGTYIYHVGELISQIKGDRGAPFHTGNYNSWTAPAITDSSAIYYFYSIRTYNGRIEWNYGGHYPDSWADPRYSVFYDPAKKCMVGDFKDGKIYPVGQISFDKIPGETGDSVVRFSVIGKNLAVYFNNRETIAGVKDQLFWVSPLNGWTKPQSQFLVGSTGWGYALIPIGDLPSVTDFNFGGNFTAKSWAEISKSYFYDWAKQCLSFKFIKVDASAKAVAPWEEAQTNWQVVPAK